ncbi:HAMP domain-containing histidine kinase [bacterium]|nr:HAMP domain-containing histidine kinase [bacterium]
MRNKFNTLQKYIFEYSVKEYRKETVNGLFRSILEPIVSNQKFESCILFRLFDLKEKENYIKRLEFSGAKIVNFSNALENNCEKQNIWEQTEFVIVLGQRYSVALIWDYSTGSMQNCTNVCCLYNSSIITEIAKLVLENSTYDFKELLQKYVPDRRQNLILNNAMRNLADCLNDKNEEILYKIAESKHPIDTDDMLKTANIVSEKAKFIAHEIKNNLSIVNLYSKITEKRLANVVFDDDTKLSIDTAIKNINTASETISSLINDLRSLSAPYITKLSIKTLVLNTVLLCEEKAKKAGVELIVTDFSDCMIDTDKVKFESALTNLIFNAIEACTEGCSVCVDCFVEPKEVRVFVKNDGDKIPSALHNKIFEVDFTTKQKGNGLGLAICKSQMRLVNGDINLVHSNNVETLFEIVMLR